MLHLIKRALTIAALIAAFCASTAGAQVVPPNPGQQVAVSPPAAAFSQPTARTVVPNPDEQMTAVPNKGPAPAPQAGFKWGDAGIGAGVTLGLAGLIVIGLYATSQRRERRPASQASMS